MANSRVLIYPDPLIDANLVSTADWSTDLSGSTTYFTEFKRTTTSSNTRELAIDPFGNNKYLWKTDKGTTTSGNWGAGMEGPWIAIDKTKTYRMSCWVKRVKAATNDSNFYFGLRASDSVTLMNVKQVTTGASSVNRYFAAHYTNDMDVVFPTGEWRFLSYLVRPYGYAGTTNDSNSGIWKPDGTSLGISVGDQIFDNAAITHLLFRIYAPYEQDYTINSNWYVADPRIDLVDGTEPSFQQLLTGNANLKPLHLDHRSDINLNIVSTADWPTDLDGSTNNFIEYNFSDRGTNTRESVTGPFGESVYAWKALTTVNASRLGFNVDLTSNVNAFPIDNTKKYRMSMWVRRTVSSASAEMFYFSPAATDGSSNVSMELYTTGADSTYAIAITAFATLNAHLPENTWRLLVVIINPAGTTGASTDTGIYALDGTKVANYTDMRWKSTATYGGMRCYAPYAGLIGSTTHYAYPRFDLMDGTEPTFQELLTGRKPIMIADQGDVPTSGDFKMIISSGISSGSDVTRLQFTVNANTTATMSGNGYFTSSDDSQNLGQSIALNSGSLQTIYLHLSDGATCDFTVVGGISKILTIGGYLRSGSGSSCRIEELDLGYNMPANATSIDLSGDIITELRGNVSTFPTGLETLYLGNSVSTCTVSFDLADLPSSLVNLSVYNNPADGRSVHGDISNVSNVTDVNLSECGPVSYTSGSSWDGELLYPIKIKPRAGSSLTVTEVNNLLTDLYNSRNVDYPYPQNALIDVRGGNPAPTGTGITAYNNLLALGIPVYTNLTEVTNTYTSAGSTSLVIPANTARLIVECWGAGGVGGSASSESRWGGGGGGGYSKSVVTAPTAETLTVVVGTGGSGTKASYLQRPSLSYYALAKAGNNAGTSANGAAGASTSGAVGTVAMYAGGNGGDASAFVSGGGGGGANTTSAGANASGSTPGSTGDGGNGGAGRSSAGVGTSGSQPGGGGGGGFGANNAGGNGGNGKVVVTYQYSA